MIADCARFSPHFSQEIGAPGAQIGRKSFCNKALSLEQRSIPVPTECSPRLACCSFTDARHPAYVEHAVETLVMQRVVGSSPVLAG